MRSKTYILFLLVLFVSAGVDAFSQKDSVTKAALILQDQNMPEDVRSKQALEIIDRAILHPECANDGYSWYVRGFIYKEWYKAFESQNKKSKTRLDAISFLKKAQDLLITDTSLTAVEYKESIRKTLKFLGSKFWNDASSSLDATNYQTAIEAYERFKECFIAAEPTYNLKPREIDFNNALASVYEKIFRSDIKANAEFLGKTEALYKQVITLDTNNRSANYNLAMLYYNYGVDVINAMDVSSDIIVIENIQEEAKAYFKKALPYALKSYALDPKRKEVLIALQGIYFSLYEFEKSDEFKAMLEKLEKEK